MIASRGRALPMHRLVALLPAACLLAGCAAQRSAPDGLLGLVTPYRIEVVQGNVLTREQVEAVKPGMTRAQVRDLLGSPLLTDPFHGDRWDYIFTIRRQGTEPQRRSVVVLFDGDVLRHIEAPELPSEQEFVASISTHKGRGTPATLELTEDQRKALPQPAARSAAAQPQAEPAGPARDYPPLEAP